MDVFIVKVEYTTALLVPKIERAITKHGEIISQTNTCAQLRWIIIKIRIHLIQLD